MPRRAWIRAQNARFWNLLQHGLISIAQLLVVVDLVVTTREFLWIVSVIHGKVELPLTSVSKIRQPARPTLGFSACHHIHGW
jgi:hypothetical protein